MAARGVLPSAECASRWRPGPGTGVYNLGGRRLDPGVGRFVGADSYVGAAANMGLALDPLTGNRYLYAGANPAGLVDDGHAPKWLENAWKAGKRALKNPAVRMVVAGAVCFLLSAGIGCVVVAGAVLATTSYVVDSKTRTVGGAVKAGLGGWARGCCPGFPASSRPRPPGSRHRRP